VDTFLDSEIEIFIEPGERPNTTKGQPCLFLNLLTRFILFEEASSFLLDEYVKAGASRSMHTWSKAAYCLRTWLQYCQAIRKDWRSVSSIDRTDFRDALYEAISPHTGEVYGTKGIWDTMVVVRRFYAYSAKKQWYFGDIAEEWTSKADGESENSFSRGGYTSTSIRIGKRKFRDKDLPKVARNQKRRSFRVDDLHAFNNYCGPQATNRNGDVRNCRDRLIVDIGVFVGLRVQEIVNLTTLQFLNLNPDPSAPYVSQRITIKGKGEVVREVTIPNWLVFDVLEYINTERKSALANCKQRFRNVPIQLLVGHVGARNGEGRPISVNAIQKMMERACLAIGLVDTEQKINADTGDAYLLKVARYSVHDLRHTYAVFTYHLEVKNGNAEPWKVIQIQLGHSKLETTINNYLACVEVFSEHRGLYSLHRSMGMK
jgi:integrase